MAHPTGESESDALRLDFDRRLKLEFHGSNVTSDAGLLPFRELDDALALTEMAGAVLSDGRRGKNTRHVLSGLLRQSVFGRLAGYEDVNDADRLAWDPAMHWIVGGRFGSRLRRFSQPDGPVRDGVAGKRGEPCRACRSLRSVDRPRSWPPTAEDNCSRHGFECQPDLRRSGGHGLQWALRLHLLSPAVRVQSVR